MQSGLPYYSAEALARAIKIYNRELLDVCNDMALERIDEWCLGQLGVIDDPVPGLPMWVRADLAEKTEGGAGQSPEREPEPGPEEPEGEKQEGEAPPQELLDEMEKLEREEQTETAEGEQPEFFIS